jgi:uncharacterized protein (TIRG00374 family)
VLTGKASRSIQIVVGLLVSAVCLVLAFRAVPLDEVGRALERANYWWLVPAVVAQLLAAFTRARRWQVLLGGQAPFWELFWAQAIGFLFTNVLPLRAGEAARIVVANRRTGLPLVQLGLSVVVERALDMLMVLLLLGVVMLLMPVPAYVTSAALALATLVVLAGLILLALAFRRGAYVAIAATLVRWLPRRLVDPLAARWHELMLGLQAVRQPLLALRATGWSLVTWAAYVAALWAIIEAFVPGASFVEPAFATVALAFGVTVPSSPGFIGVFQLVGQQALVVPFPERYSPSAALSIALLANLVDLGPPSVLGLIGLLRLGISPGTLRQPLQAEADPNVA